MSEIKAELLSDLDFLGSITERTKQQIESSEFKTPYFAFLDGNKIAEIIVASLADETKLQSLKTKLGITSLPSPTGTSGGNPMGTTTGTQTTGMPGTSSGTVPGMTTTGMPGTSGGNVFTQPFPTATPVTSQPVPSTTP